MKKLIILFIFFAVFAGVIYADQLAYITKAQAERGAAFIKSQSEVLLFCGCCDDDPKIFMKVKDVSVKHTGYQDYYEIVITGVTREGKQKTVEADLAYIHVNKNGFAVSVGKILGYECDPCTAEFPWSSDIRDGAGQK